MEYTLECPEFFLRTETCTGPISRFDAFLLASGRQCLALSGLSDLVDGKIARKYHMTSDLGKVLDPIADKLTQVTLVVCLISRHRQLCYVLALQIVKELTMAGAGLLVLKRTKQVYSAILPGKICTVCLDISLLLLFLFPQMPEPAVWLLTLLCCCAIIVSLGLYLAYYHALLGRHTAGQPALQQAPKKRQS